MKVETQFIMGVILLIIGFIGMCVASAMETWTGWGISATIFISSPVFIIWAGIRVLRMPY